MLEAGSACPEMAGGHEPSVTLKDNDFATIFAKIPAGVEAIWIADSCHSGDLTKGASGLGGRRLRRRFGGVCDEFLYKVKAPGWRRALRALG